MNFKLKTIISLQKHSYAFYLRFFIPTHSYRYYTGTTLVLHQYRHEILPNEVVNIRMTSEFSVLDSSSSMILSFTPTK